MRKTAAALALAFALAFATVHAAFGASMNPFMDVPRGHWSYDAVRQLASRWLPYGYTYEAFKNSRLSTRYEMASTVAHALPYVDMNSASERNIDSLRRLVNEFSDELEDLGVNVGKLDGRIAPVEKRVGSWRWVSRRSLMRTAELLGEDYAPPKGEDGASRLDFRRWLGWRRRSGTRRFSAEFPIRLGSDRLADSGGQPAPGALFGFSASSLTNFSDLSGTSIFRAYAGPPTDDPFAEAIYINHAFNESDFNVWELSFMASLSAGDIMGFSAGFDGFVGEGSSNWPFGMNSKGDWPEEWGGLSSVWTIYGGMRVELDPSTAFRGVVYHQTVNGEREIDDVIIDDTRAFRLVIDLKQDVLKFTGLWLEYDRMQKGFWLPGYYAMSGGNFGVDSVPDKFYDITTDILPEDMSLWRVMASREWDDRWKTFLFMANATFMPAGTGNPKGRFIQWGMGVEYAFTPDIVAGFSYMRQDYNMALESVELDSENLFHSWAQMSF
ncbi:MAG: hypothetical protein LBR38_06290 [Synergistaceae bacterium]|jgi:hypothetical protein|nr:hypothetical protein [Synergistaceae bacterium]